MPLPCVCRFRRLAACLRRAAHLRCAADDARGSCAHRPRQLSAILRLCHSLAFWQTLRPARDSVSGGRFWKKQEASSDLDEDLRSRRNLHRDPMIYQNTSLEGGSGGEMLELRSENNPRQLRRRRSGCDPNVSPGTPRSYSGVLSKCRPPSSGKVDQSLTGSAKTWSIWAAIVQDAVECGGRSLSTTPCMLNGASNLGVLGVARRAVVRSPHVPPIVHLWSICRDSWRPDVPQNPDFCNSENVET